MNKKDTASHRSRRVWIVILTVLLLNWIIARVLVPTHNESAKIPYTVFKQQVAQKNVARISVKETAVTGTFVKPIANGSEARYISDFSTTLPPFLDPGLEKFLVDNGVEITAEAKAGNSPWMTMLVSFGPGLLSVIGWLWLSRVAAKRGVTINDLLTGTKRGTRRADRKSRGKAYGEARTPREPLPRHRRAAVQ